ncbi:protein of unknown function (plasmid) [Azospirillum baldaniorum]|uniref:Uncharacterized protein n=1 Tax=Azospirillum baldaniorum TaxID=1064539 RepID=A0A9P1JU56_9PROT|nr:protein of unknown function [Azospirillum baldaniorum]
MERRTPPPRGAADALDASDGTAETVMAEGSGAVGECVVWESLAPTLTLPRWAGEGI